MINVAAFIDSLKYMGIGMAAIFIIISVIILLLYGLVKCFPDRPEKKEDK